MSQTRNRQSMPLVSLIVPVRNEERYIRQTLLSLLHQDYPSECLEILVADGMSEDRTRSIIAKVQQQHDRKIIVIDNPRRTTAAGMNRGLLLARGDVVILVGGHCRLAPDYISQCVNHLLDPNVDCVGGVIKTVAEGAKASAIAAAMTSPFGVGNSPFRVGTTGPRLVDTVAFGAYKRDAVMKAGLFDETMLWAEDDEYNYRLRHAGGLVLLDPQISATYYARPDFGGLWRQYFGYGSGKVPVLLKHPRQMQLRQFIPPLFVLALLGALLLAVPLLAGKLLLAAVLAAYGVANLAASLQAARQHSVPILPFLPIAFVVLHVSYGSGFLLTLAQHVVDTAIAAGRRACGYLRPR